jgi:hypothetical protein
MGPLHRQLPNRFRVQEFLKITIIDERLEIVGREQSMAGDAFVPDFARIFCLFVVGENTPMQATAYFFWGAPWIFLQFQFPASEGFEWDRGFTGERSEARSIG